MRVSLRKSSELLATVQIRAADTVSHIQRRVEAAQVPQLERAVEAAADQQALQQRLLQRHTQLDMDPLDNMQRKAWWLLYPGERAQLTFLGTRLGARSLQLTLRTEGGRPVVLRASAAASPLFYAQVVPLNWFRDKSTAPHVVAVGQCALGKGVLTVDARQRRAVWEQRTL